MKDAEDRAAGELEYMLTREKKKNEVSVPKISPEEAMSHERVFRIESKRDVTRVLFISTNPQLLNPTQQSLDGYVDIKDLFEEVHILILRNGIPPKYPVLRVASNVWLYTASSKYWWQTPFSGLKMAEEQLAFAAGFRPDLIVARDPFESAVVAIRLAKKFKRQTQLHIVDDFRSVEFLRRGKANFWRRFLTLYTLGKFDSVRTATHNLKKLIGSKYNVADLKTLPRLQNYEGLIKANPVIDVRSKYHQFSIIMLYVGELTYESALWQVIDSASFALRNERVGLIIIGNGPAKSEFEKRVKVHGIEKQVVFVSKVEDLASYLKAATMLIVPDTDGVSEEVVLKGAAAGAPLVVVTTEQRSDIFTHGESAFLCEPEDVQDMTDRINDLLNDPELRDKFIKNAQEIIKTEFHQDKKKYQEEYRLSVEQALFVGTEGALEEE